MQKLSIALVGVVFSFFACHSAKKSTVQTPESVAVQVVEAPPAPQFVSTEDSVYEVSLKGEAEEPLLLESDTLPIYRATATLENDILHTKLDVKFDWSKQRLIGKAWITAKPYFYNTQSITLDAQNFDINKVTLENGKALTYTYADNKLTINLDKVYTRNEKYTIYIDYVAKPNEGPTGGSDAITSDKGLFFINPDGSEPGKPMQIWTQGETESNSRWFPTFDKPNEKMTNEILMTVEDKYKTLSNGLLKSSRKNTDGTRTDHWVMDMPHAPYLVMMAVGDFAVVTEKWQGKDIMYYVEPKYGQYAKDIYKNVPEILTFFSNRLGVPYPWQKLANITVRDYVSGAMENTTAIIYGEFMNGTPRELIDRDYNEIVVAHEIFHHWFGDLVTTESWSNLTVNESFADFSEALWLDYKYGKDAGDHHRRGVMEGYLAEAENKMHPLVDFQYDSRESMFDAHSYNKGGGILHMLRHYLGDEAFFEGLKKYLTDNKFKTGEAHQLRLALEEVSGQDLNWFFNQWYYKSGHPVLDINYNYNAETKKASISIKQTQEGSPEVPYIFDLPLAVDLYTADGKATRQSIRINRREQTFTFDAAEKPALIDFDPERILLGLKQDNHSEEEFVFMYKHAKAYLARIEAIEALKATGKTPAVNATLTAALQDPFWAVRESALKGVKFDDPSVAETVAKIAQQDTRSTTRAAAIARLAATKDTKWAATYRTTLEKEPAYNVISQAMQALYRIDAPAALEAAKRYENDENADLLNGIAVIYAENAKVEFVPFFEKSLSKIDGMESVAFVGSYIKVLEKTKEADMKGKMNKLADIAINQSQSPWRRLACTKGIVDYRKKIKSKDASLATELTEILAKIAEKESNEQLKMIYAQMMGQ